VDGHFGAGLESWMDTLEQVLGLGWGANSEWGPSISYSIVTRKPRNYNEMVRNTMALDQNRCGIVEDL
jgi:hypothetical protein